MSHPMPVVITIAHRLATIATCDKVVVLDKGVLVEYAPPSTLLDDPTSMFYAMCNAAGNRVHLTNTAKRADDRRGASNEAN